MIVKLNIINRFSYYTNHLSLSIIFALSSNSLKKESLNAKWKMENKGEIITALNQSYTLYGSHQTSFNTYYYSSFYRLVFVYIYIFTFEL